MSRSIAIALSGGGHRATLFTLGALMYVVDSGRAGEVTSIASVSGGSITNGMVAQTLNFQTTDSDAFEEKVVAPLAGQIANRGTLFAPLLSKLYLAALVLGLPAAFLPFWCFDWAWGVKAVASLGLLIVWGWVAGKRGWVCARAFRRTLFAPSGSATLLKNIATKVSHVICATEVRASQAVYFARDFVYTHELGPGEPGDMPLYQAVQASAAFPGGFPHARLPARRHRFKGKLGSEEPTRAVSKLLLADGGAYDNMGDQWARGFRDRAKRWPWLAQEKQVPEQLVVVNASARVPWAPFRLGWIPLLGEIFAFLRTTNVMYVNTTNVRRQEIVRSYDPLAPERHGELPGVLVQITQSPFDVADNFAGAEGKAVGQRASAVIKALGEGNREGWRKIARQNAEVGTTLRKLGSEVSARLMYQGYVTAMCNLHVVFGGEEAGVGRWPLLQIPLLERCAKLVN
jgi:hypothetical protein